MESKRVFFVANMDFRSPKNVINYTPGKKLTQLAPETKMGGALEKEIPSRNHHF